PRLSATAVLDGWPPARASGRTEPGLQAGSPAASAPDLSNRAVSGSAGAHSGHIGPRWLVMHDDRPDAGCIRRSAAVRVGQIVAGVPDLGLHAILVTGQPDPDGRRPGRSAQPP